MYCCSRRGHTKAKIGPEQGPFLATGKTSFAPFLGTFFSVFSGAQFPAQNLAKTHCFRPFSFFFGATSGQNPVHNPGQNPGQLFGTTFRDKIRDKIRGNFSAPFSGHVSRPLRGKILCPSRAPLPASFVLACASLACLCTRACIWKGGVRGGMQRVVLRVCEACATRQRVCA